MLGLVLTLMATSGKKVLCAIADATKLLFNPHTAGDYVMLNQVFIMLNVIAIMLNIANY